MKLIFFYLLMVLSFITTNGQSQNIFATPSTPFYHDTLTATIDTIDISLPDLHDIVYTSISCYTISGTDTFTVYSKSIDDIIWCKQPVLDMIEDTTLAEIIITTTPKEFQLYDPQPWKIRLVCPDHTANTVFTFNGKKEGL